ncbi:MAG: 16S rRNA (cytosine(1402)-N(4))-methyltransferase RsmH [Proteobacteria bacterium]|nr:16S rRNA (cytosine(1402)-N(4))-methyltransferase RsmH [Pseudomonadota bacterium]MCH8943745.1 16S rRNA (cytosine(1402)-N(4))-methyltransferase RsmH [Pseudomonadota bacterium]
MSSNEHVPVLLGPVLDGLEIKPDGCYVDGTFGRGGHSGEILKRLNANGRLIGIDRDPDAIASAPKTLTDDSRFELIRGEIAQLQTIIGERTLIEKVDGLLFDLGVSSPQLDEASRGFSFLRDGPLDMRMDPDSGTPASDWLASVGEKELRHVIAKYGEEPMATRIARAIVSIRDSSPITTTTGLAELVASVAPARRSGKGQKRHPATKTFQAIRIVINDELQQLEAVLAQSLAVLKRGGRLCVISFHSLEDRLVKRFIRDSSREPEQYRGMPSIPDEFRPKLKRVGKVIVASAEEIAANRRSRSARLRVAERI